MKTVTLNVYGDMKIVKQGRYYSVTFPGCPPRSAKNYDSAMTFTSLGVALIRAFCFDRRATNAYLTLYTPSWYSA